MQRCKFATGIDTGCVVGDKLTAAVLPSASELEESNWAPPSEGTTFESLGTELVGMLVIYLSNIYKSSFKINFKLIRILYRIPLMTITLLLT